MTEGGVVTQEVQEVHVTDLTEEEPGLAAALLRVDVARHGESGHQHLAETQSNTTSVCPLRHLLSIGHGRLQQLLEVGVLGLALVASGPPLGDRLAVEDEDLGGWELVEVDKRTDICPWVSATWKNVSISRILSGWMLEVSSSTGSGGPEKL